ncbi:hypothetical protein P691DRAFT_230709 [Macrolepiota fuliginosa MF-IS2]|uniref:Uncharacterized protein n=1 Tax=Macrolepiota fuliginosa MF-IS2 TaxID=1400762 RepID=A0A9P6C001_9AGAR|nr:hypothetical protein P691DRAFT_230709 [Macrolepiota fuliginosa MF-IS2]
MTLARESDHRCPVDVYNGSDFSWHPRIPPRLPSILQFILVQRIPTTRIWISPLSIPDR